MVTRWLCRIGTSMGMEVSQLLRIDEITRSMRAPTQTMDMETVIMEMVLSNHDERHRVEQRQQQHPVVHPPPPLLVLCGVTDLLEEDPSLGTPSRRPRLSPTNNSTSTKRRRNTRRTRGRKPKSIRNHVNVLSAEVSPLLLIPCRSRGKKEDDEDTTMTCSRNPEDVEIIDMAPPQTRTIRTTTRRRVVNR